MYTSKIYEKGQTTLPREVRAVLRIEPEDRIAYEISPMGVTIRKLRPQGVDPVLAADWLSREDREDFHDL